MDDHATFVNTIHKTASTLILNMHGTLGTFMSYIILRIHFQVYSMMWIMRDNLLMFVYQMYSYGEGALK